MKLQLCDFGGIMFKCARVIKLLGLTLVVYPIFSYAQVIDLPKKPINHEINRFILFQSVYSVTNKEGPAEHKDVVRFDTMTGEAWVLLIEQKDGVLRRTWKRVSE
jgi:hypothetical protein